MPDTTEQLIIRQEHLRNLNPFCRGLCAAVSRSGLKPEAATAALKFSLAAECVQCGIQISGEELLSLIAPVESVPANPKLERLRLGDCARKGCDSFYYRISLKNHAQLHWPTLLESAEKNPVSVSASSEINESPDGAPKSANVFKDGINFGALSRSPMLWRCCAGVVIIGVFLAFRQLYLGGRIPLIREPEHFKVAPAPAGEEENGG